MHNRISSVGDRSSIIIVYDIYYYVKYYRITHLILFMSLLVWVCSSTTLVQ